MVSKNLYTIAAICKGGWVEKEPPHKKDDLSQIVLRVDSSKRPKNDKPDFCTDPLSFGCRHPGLQ